jgi:hypothetical protein
MVLLWVLPSKKLRVSLKVGSHKHCVIQLNGSTLDININEVKCVPDLYINLLSMNKAIPKRFNLSNIGTAIKIQDKWKDKLVRKNKSML